MSTSTIPFVILGAGILAAIAVTALEIARISRQPKCPICGGQEVFETGVSDFDCDLCGHKWRDLEPKRFGGFPADL